MLNDCAPCEVLVMCAHPIFTAGVAKILEHEANTMVVTTACTEAELYKLAVDHQKKIVLIDFDLSRPEKNALKDWMTNCEKSVHFIVISSHDNNADVQSLLSAGARGFVHKSSDPEILRQAIRAVFAGGVYLDPTVAGRLLATGHLRQKLGSTEEAAHLPLTDRERDVFRLIAFGYSNKEVAFRLGITSKSVETYKARACNKLDIRSRAKIVGYALSQGWLTDLAE